MKSGHPERPASRVAQRRSRAGISPGGAASYCVVATRTAARICELPGRAAIQARLRSLLQKVRAGEESRAEAQALGAAIFDHVPEISRKGRLIVSPDGDLHQLPFELLLDPSGKRLLARHVVSYIPSGSR